MSLTYTPELVPMSYRIPDDTSTRAMKLLTQLSPELGEWKYWQVVLEVAKHHPKGIPQHELMVNVGAQNRTRISMWVNKLCDPDVYKIEMNWTRLKAHKRRGAGLLQQIDSPFDSRVKLVILSQEGIEFLEKVMRRGTHDTSEGH